MSKDYTTTITTPAWMYWYGKIVSILCIGASIIWLGMMVFSPKAQAEGIGSVLGSQGMWMGIFVLMIGIIGWVFTNRFKQK